MKLSLITAAVAVLAATGCSEPADDKKQDPPAAPATPNDQAPGRQLIDGKSITTTPVNLLGDPGFVLAGQQSGYGAFIGFYDTGADDRFTLDSVADSRSPATFGGRVAIVRPANATNTTSRSLTLITSFLGGNGPFHAQIWVSKSDINGHPVDVPTDGSAVTASISDGALSFGGAFDLAVDPSATRNAGGRTWVLLRGDITKPMDNGAFFLIHTGTNGGYIHLAAPQVTSDEITVGQAVMSLRKGAMVAAARPKTALERRAIRAYTSIPPRLVPAAPKAPLTD